MRRVRCAEARVLLLEVLLQNLISHQGKQAMGYREVEILDDLHIVGGNNQCPITQGLHESTLESAEPDRNRARFPGQLDKMAHLTSTIIGGSEKTELSHNQGQAEILRGSSVIGK